MLGEKSISSTLKIVVSPGEENSANFAEIILGLVLRGLREFLLHIQINQNCQSSNTKRSLKHPFIKMKSAKFFVRG